ncbi:MAG: class I SAM-dependent methyltransferase [Sulfobacillus sp.]
MRTVGKCTWLRDHGGRSLLVRRAGTDFAREIYWLTRLAGNEFCPRLNYSDPQARALVMFCEGNALSAENLPDDFQTQLMRIIHGIWKIGYRHFSLRTENLICDLRKIKVVSFAGMAPETGDETLDGKLPQLSEKRHEFQVFHEIRTRFKKQQWKSYEHPARKSHFASEAQRPGISVGPSDIKVIGAQNFRIAGHRLTTEDPALELSGESLETALEKLSQGEPGRPEPEPEPKPKPEPAPKSKLIGSSLLDIGCGCGYQLLYLLEKGRFASVVGIDHDREQIDIARTIGALEKLSGKAAFHVEKLSESVARGRRAEVVTCVNTLNWLFVATELAGSLEMIVFWLAQLSERALVLQWVPQLMQSPEQSPFVLEGYEKTELVKALRRYFDKVDELETPSGTYFVADNKK